MSSLRLSKEDQEKSGLHSRCLARLHPLNEAIIQIQADLTDEFNKAVGTSLNANIVFNSPTWGRCSYISVAFPDCLPERLPAITRAITIGFLHDDYFDTEEDEKIEGLQTTFSSLLRSGVETSKASVSGGFTRLKQLQAKIMLELLDLDYELGKAIMDTWSRDSAALSETTCSFKTLEEYYQYRMSNGAIYLTYKWACFGLDITLSSDEEKKLSDIVDPNLLSAALENDFYSWPKEVKVHAERQSPGIPPNAVGVVMQERKCSEKEALQTVLEMAAEMQDTHLFRLQKYKQTVGDDLPEAHQKYIEFSQAAAAGNEYFSKYSFGRYPSKTLLNQPECEVVDGNLRFMKVVDCDQTQEEISTSTAMTPSTTGMTNDATLHTNGNINGDINYDDTHSNGIPTSNGLIGITPKPSNHLALAPYQYISCLPSKGFRDAFIDALNWWMDVPGQTLYSVKLIIISLHGASLMLDDIQDESRLRRGKPATHTVYGAAQTINSATYMIVNMFREVNNLNNPALASILTSFDLYWKHHIQIPSISDYMMMVDNKTGGQLRLCVGMMQAEATSSDGQMLDFGRFTTLLGRYYQIRDDYQNLTSEQYTSQKGFCEDLDEGKISFPLIYCLSKSDEYKRAQILGIFQLKRSEGLSFEMKSFILHLMQECHALSHTKHLIQKMQSDLLQELKYLEVQMGTRNSVLELSLRKLWI